ncbi:MAG: SDR family NAD(P)-dependent oxidoreductase [Chloroflexota bacterium]
MTLDGKRIILTGAASGIGASLLKLLAHFNADIIAVDLEQGDTPSGKARITWFNGDLSMPETIDSLLVTAVAQLGGIDVFIANAGFAYYETADRADWEHIARIYRVNVFSPLYALARLRELNANAASYSFVITTSAMARVPIPGYAHYGATKAALHHFAEAYRFEQPPNEHLMLVYPIATRTGFFNRAADGTPVLHPNQTPAYVARRMLNGLIRQRQQVYPSLGFMVFSTLGRAFPPFNTLYQRYAAWLHRRWQRRQHDH